MVSRIRSLIVHHHHADAEDIAQQVWTEAWELLMSGEGYLNATWLRLRTDSRIVDHRRRTETREQKDQLDELKHDTAIHMHIDERIDINTCLSRMTTQEATIGRLFLHDGLTQTEIVNQLDLTEMTVSRKLGRVLGSLSDMLGGILPKTTKPKTIKTKAFVLEMVTRQEKSAAQIANDTGMNRKVVAKQLERLRKAGVVTRDEFGVYKAA